MKELSIEEKAKRYDEAIEIARQIHDADRVSGIELTTCEEIFPELNESEDKKDERIIKALIRLVNNYPSMDFFLTYDIHSYEAIDWLEKQDGQKPADKPKFKTGDWCIDNEDGTIFQIVKVLDNTYTYKTNEGKEYSCTHYSLENDARLWNISDAKDGDVLAYNDSKNNVWICIFKEYSNERVYDYCTLDKESFWEYGNWNYLASFSYIPATKEQRDLLFSNMKESGYTFDFEKKEMKKIIDEKQIKKNLQDNSFRRMFDTWGEEDEKMCQETIDWFEKKCFPYALESENPARESINWLKSIKDRVLPQPQKEWSEDDERMYRGLHNLIYSTPYCDSRKELSDWLKALKDIVQSKQEWGKEDEKCIRLTTDIIDSALRAGFCVQLDRDRCVDWLKSLKDRYTWKPSDEQMIALEYFVRSIGESGYASPYDNNTKLLYSLLSDLKKLKEE